MDLNQQKSFDEGYDRSSTGRAVEGNKSDNGEGINVTPNPIESMGFQAKDVVGNDRINLVEFYDAQCQASTHSTSEMSSSIFILEAENGKMDTV